ncbi:MAG TPA: nucleotide exchange factor GrpE [Candidatus Thermoplasmatota archaeon]|nr:nucleotide exchange factor GrpE [Candidatus Thermoplasmatota archaeon]
MDEADPKAAPEPGTPASGSALDPPPESIEALARLEAELDAARARVVASGQEAEAERVRAAELRERYLRLAAEFDNFRKRKERDLDEARVRAREEVIQRFLDVLSNFDRALEGHGDAEALHQGMTLIHRQIKTVLEAMGVQRIDTEGHLFDPARHEAVLREETTRYKDGVIITELEKGYTLHGRVLRPARVKVAAAPPPPPEGEGGQPPG